MRLHQIYEDDLAELEKLLPELQSALFSKMDNRLRIKLRRCKAIISDVRWDYGPPEEVYVIECGDGGDPPLPD